MEGMGLILAKVRHLLGPISMFGLWLALLGFIASSNRSNIGYNLPSFAHFPQPATSSPPAHSLPYL